MVAMEAGDHHLYAVHRSTFVVVDLMGRDIVFRSSAFSIDADLALADDILYWASGDRVHIVDVSAPSTPMSAGEAALELVMGVGEKPGMLYAVTGGSAPGGSTLFVLDVTEPSTPAVLGSIPIPGAATDVVISGSHAYVSGFAGRALTVVNIEDPEMPEEVGFLDGLSASGLAVTGKFALLLSTGVVIADVAEPSRPEVRATVPLGQPQHVVARGNFAFAATMDADDPEQDGVAVVRLCEPGRN